MFNKVDRRYTVDHKCQCIAKVLPCSEGRIMWVGKLLEPIPGFEMETHCIHIVTPLKDEVVFVVHEGDAALIAVVAQIIHGSPVDQSWLSSMERIMRAKARTESEQE